MEKIKDKNKCKKKINKAKKNSSIRKDSICIKDYFVAGCNVNYS